MFTHIQTTEVMLKGPHIKMLMVSPLKFQLEQVVLHLKHC